MSLGLDIGHFKSKIVMLSGSGENIEALKVDNCDTFNDLNLFDPETITKAQWVASIQDLFKELKINPEIVNIEGGAIALGHPLGATGTRITAKAASLMIKHNKKYALATQCIGLGQGIATVLERVD